MESLAQTNPDELENVLLDRVAAGFALDARGIDDAGAMLFGQAAERGVRLLQLLDKQYAVVVTNPPYMGSKNMDTMMLKYVERHFSSGKRDLYAAFILRNIDFTVAGGRVAMVTQQSWMFLSSFADLRAVPEDELSAKRIGGEFTGLLRETVLEGLVHLGRYAFSEIGNAVVAPVLFAVRDAAPTEDSKLWACRLNVPRPSAEQANLLQASVSRFSKTDSRDTLVTHTRQNDLLEIQGGVIAYYLTPAVLAIFATSPELSAVADVRQGYLLNKAGRAGSRAERTLTRHIVCYSHAAAKGAATDGGVRHGAGTGSTERDDRSDGPAQRD